MLAVAQESNRDATKPKVVNAVTLEVAPQQAEKLDLARSVGTLSLVLRNQVDPNLGETDGATKTSLLDQPEPPQASSSATQGTCGGKTRRCRQAYTCSSPSRECVEVIRGTSKSMECF